MFLIHRIPNRYKRPAFLFRAFAYLIPLAFFVYVLYWNFLPFGYNKTFTIDVGSASDQSGSFFLGLSPSLSDRLTGENPHRVLNGPAYAVFRPQAALRDVRMTLEVEGGNVSVMPFEISSDYTRIPWDFVWDMRHGKRPTDLTGNATFSDSCAYFNPENKSALELTNSKDKFETGAFSVFVEWMPEDDIGASQEILGHFNWDILQNSDSVSFRVGRMDNADGGFFTVKYPVSSDFFGVSHTALAIYHPSPTNGYIDLYVDEHYAGRSYFQPSVIWADYNGNRDLTFGKTDHGESSYFHGCIYQVGILNGVAVEESKKVSFRTTVLGEELWFPIMSTASSTLEKIRLHVED